MPFRAPVDEWLSDERLLASICGHTDTELTLTIAAEAAPYPTIRLSMRKTERIASRRTGSSASTHF